MDYNGNCLFRALSNQLFGGGGEEVRRSVCNYITDPRKKVFEPFLLGDNNNEDMMDIDLYIKTMMGMGDMEVM